ncbi:hypothetical protein T10_11103 [Trichinella papuae]|uniref:Uncharacterized protein n=1 Tax=Trichinella papuae TaxID=268474 RepID=A0A0V1M791_9BILA|nr:hypothetical protein T10_11103 [Trichinella papuae]
MSTSRGNVFFCHFEFTKAVQTKLHFQLYDDAQHITSVQLIFLQKRGIKQSLKTPYIVLFEFELEIDPYNLCK